tara:strand:- start:4712 stop:5059 length:348 start_codon:yes stop_codon:yes gene_type:complete
MTDLIAVLSTGKGTWGHVSGLINGEDWNKIYLLTNEFGKETFKPNEKTELIVFDFNSKKLSEEIFEKLKDKVSGEVAINFISGSGKEHMALISALIKLGVGFRLVVSEEGKVEEI